MRDRELNTFHIRAPLRWSAPTPFVGHEVMTVHPLKLLEATVAANMRVNAKSAHLDCVEKLGVVDEMR